ncbi:hypothetical protein GQ600_627 [Phytophthora cactorum]|nr:hypothetical protein GQ600_627 [Phytophthora cactorum]
MPVDYTTTRAFDDAEKLALTRAWVAVVGITECKLRTNYSLNAQDRAAEELLAQWQTLVQSMDDVRAEILPISNRPSQRLGMRREWNCALTGEDGGNQELDRRVRQRLNVESPILQGPKAEILLSPLGSTSSELSPSSAHVDSNLEIMTQSQEGLSDDAVEYPRWQRRLVLAKMRQQARGNNKDQV